MVKGSSKWPREGVNRPFMKFNQLHETSQNTEPPGLIVEVPGRGGSMDKRGTSRDQSKKSIYCRI
jgi:hypothetical protein